jgi:hypothetical protein
MSPAAIRGAPKVDRRWKSARNHFSPEGRHLAVINTNGTVAIVRLAPVGNAE